MADFGAIFCSLADRLISGVMELCRGQQYEMRRATDSQQKKSCRSFPADSFTMLLPSAGPLPKAAQAMMALYLRPLAAVMQTKE